MPFSGLAAATEWVRNLPTLTQYSVTNDLVYWSFISTFLSWTAP